MLKSPRHIIFEPEAILDLTKTIYITTEFRDLV